MTSFSTLLCIWIILTSKPRHHNHHPKAQHWNISIYIGHSIVFQSISKASILWRRISIIGMSLSLGRVIISRRWIGIRLIYLGHQYSFRVSFIRFVRTWDRILLSIGYWGSFCFVCDGGRPYLVWIGGEMACILVSGGEGNTGGCFGMARVY